MQLICPEFTNQGMIPAKYTCDGKNISPPLKFVAVPDNTISLVLIMEDPDVPLAIRPDGMWNHWLVWNIYPETLEVPAGENPPGQVGKNTRGAIGYGGPCPPDREHRYFFKLFALDIELELPPDATKKNIEDAMIGHIIEKTELMGRYNRLVNQE